jgi:hypothetical protein
MASASLQQAVQQLVVQQQPVPSQLAPAIVD